MSYPAAGEFRPYPLDGAMLYFHAATGTHVRVESRATLALTRQAPRVVMFGITNACNLTCGFCSRDTSRASAWSVDSAAEVLEGLARAGTLEVAFGGGEPFAFRGFEELLLRLHKTTDLALNVTTNGALLRDDVLARLSGALGQVRVSIYENEDWRRAAGLLLRAGQTWGANLLVHAGTLPGLPSLLLELAALGARDVSLLSYVGSDPDMMLGPQEDEALAAIIRASPLPCRVSVCFGARLGVERLFDGVDGDCGAGLDFLTITSDKQVQSCSFQDESCPIASAEDVLATWRVRRDLLRRASPRRGCARTEHRAPRVGRPGIRVWQAFSGNNSGECVLVAKFESAEDAEKLLADLIPGYAPGQAYSAPWKELLQCEGICDEVSSQRLAPDDMVAVGRSFIAWTEMEADDAFPELRALSWKRGGEVVAGGIHVHDGVTALAVVRGRNASDAASTVKKGEDAGAVAIAHGPDVIVALSEWPPRADPQAPRVLSSWRDVLKALAGERPWSMELVFEKVDADMLTAAAKALANPPAERSRLLFRFWSYQDDRAEKQARELARETEGATRAENLVLVDKVVRRKRLALRGHRKGASVSALDGETVRIVATFRPEGPPPRKGTKAPKPEPLTAEAVERDLGDRLRLQLRPKAFELTKCGLASWGVYVHIHTSSPADVLTVITKYSAESALATWISIDDIDTLGRAVRRLLDDVAALERARRR